jgi:hypothetical protein
MQLLKEAYKEANFSIDPNTGERLIDFTPSDRAHMWSDALKGKAAPPEGLSPRVADAFNRLKDQTVPPATPSETPSLPAVEKTSEAPVSAAVESEVNINPGGNAVKLAVRVAPTALAMYGTWTYLEIQQHANEIKNKGPGSMTKTDYLFMERAGWNFKGIDADTMKGKWERSLMHKLEDGFWGLLNIPAILTRPKSSSPWGARGR